MESLRNALFHHPDTLSLQILEILGILGAVNLCSAELKGKGVKYSKFAENKGRLLPSRIAMFICYTPALSLCTTFLLIKLAIAKQYYTTAPPFFVPANPRLLILAAALTVHFLKRDLEVLFLHRYSGSMEAKSCITISCGYFFTSLQLLYAQQSSFTMQPPATNLLPLGVILLVVGLSGNFYHHYLLAKLRPDNSNSTKRYLVPSGGLFTLVVCPHYFFETIVFLGIALIGQTTLASIVFLATLFYLGAHSYNTKLWYLQKIEDFPHDRKAFIPHIF